MSACLYLFSAKDSLSLSISGHSIKQITLGYPRGWALGWTVRLRAGATLASL